MQGAFSADLDHIGGRRCGGFGVFHELLRNGIELRRLGALGAGQGNGQSAVAAFADSGDQLNGAEEGNVELLCCALCAAAGEDVDLFGAVRLKAIASQIPL